MSDGRVLIVGGGLANAIGAPAGLEVRADALIYDPVAGRVDETIPLLQARHFHHAARLPSGKVLVFGGADDVSTVRPSQGSQNPQPFGAALASAELFDPATHTFTATGALRQARYAFASATLGNGQVMAIGGATYADGNAISLASSERYDEGSGTFHEAASLDGSDRLFHAAVALRDDEILVYGGKHSNVRFLDDWQHLPAPDASWTSAGTLGSARTLGRLVALRDGGALLIGGLACNASGCEVPRSTGVWHAGSSTEGIELRQGRSAPGVSTLPDGRIVITGGLGRSGAVMASTEILGP